ncbi:hypothetical protein EJB05_12711, partial [Eragrostis curvula]
MAAEQLRLRVLATVMAALVGICGGFELHEATRDVIQLGFRNGSLTSTALVRFYLDQIGRLNPLLQAVIEVNPDALAQAARADAERAAGRGGGGSLHGVPVLLKDNIATHDRLNTTAGSLALLGSVVRRDAGVVSRLRRAGAVILGKANPSEWSNFRPVESGWSARGGQTLNPYVLSVTPCGSSSGPGVAAAANMAAVTLGSETDGSILCPSSLNSVVGIKPTVGLTSRSGVIPITPRQDTIGPMCRTVSDAVHVLDAIVGYDAFDAAATGAASRYVPRGGYTQFLKVHGLKGKRIGVFDGIFEIGGAQRVRVYKKHLRTMRQHGAIVIKHLDMAINLTDLSIQEATAMTAEFKLSLNAYLTNLLYSPVRSLAEVIAFNNAHPVQERLKDFGQPNLIAAEKTNGIGKVEREAIRRLDEMSMNGLEKLIKEHQLDAIVAPDSIVSSILAIGGYPGIVVPAGYDKQGVPFALCFGGLKGYEPRLIEMAYAFEQATRDNIATCDRLNTTAGSLALLGSVVRRDAGVVTRLRRAGAVILGKANPSEWSNFRPVEDGWSARGGQTLNPYVLSSSSCGSSAGPGVAAAANMAAVTLGSETDGSILWPSSANSVVGIKPTPIRPMCRTVSDAVHVLDAIVGYDALDAEATRAASKYIPPGGYTQFLRIDGLEGKRIGVPDAFFQGIDAQDQGVYKNHLQTMRQHGAIVIEDIDIAANLTDLYSQETVAMNAEFKISLNAYLSDLLYSPVRSLADVIAFNNAHPVQERLKDFGQPDLIAAEKTNGIGKVETEAIRWLNELSINGFEKFMNQHQLDAIVAPNSDASSILAIGGYPGIVVPAGYDKQGVPFGLCFGGLKGYEPRLIEMAYAFEQATK